jgi:hypothetical protein
MERELQGKSVRKQLTLFKESFRPSERLNRMLCCSRTKLKGVPLHQSALVPLLAKK